MPHSIVGVRTALGAGILAAALSVSSPALAATIDFSSTACANAACLLTGGVDGDVNLTSIGGTFAYKTHNGSTGLGVTDLTGDPTPGEIDVDEAISGAFTLSGGVRIDGFELLFIYNGPEYSDPFELATITVNGIPYTFQVDAENSGTWSGVGSVTNCGVTADIAGGSGCFSFSNPFGNTLVTSISFAATSVSQRPPAANDSDYSLGSLSYSAPPDITNHDSAPVPEPASMVLLGSGLVGIVAARRRARAKSRQNS